MLYAMLTEFQLQQPQRIIFLSLSIIVNSLKCIHDSKLRITKCYRKYILYFHQSNFNSKSLEFAVIVMQRLKYSSQNIVVLLSLYQVYN